MYWLHSGNPLDFIPWLVTTFFWALGGWLLAMHAFNLEKNERIMVGLGLGMVIYTWLSNLLGHWLPPGWAFFLAGVLTLVLGLAFAWKSIPMLDPHDLSESTGQIVIFIILLFLFVQMTRGLAIYDEPKNLTIISRMAAGDIPPHFYMNSDFYFRYHYGSQLFAATLMRLGGLFPWSAFDVMKSFCFALTVILASLIGQRYSGKQWAGVVAGSVIAFASGTRYLLLLLPTSILLKLDPVIQMLGTSEGIGGTFSRALSQGWIIEGGPPYPIPFAFANGIFAPLTSLQAGSNLFSAAILLLLILLFTRVDHKYAWLVLGIILSLWGLVWESSYGLFAIGGAIALLFWGIVQTRSVRPIRERTFAVFRSIVTHPGFLALAFSVPFVLLQGGTLTETLRQATSGAAGIGVEGAVSSGGFSLRWPPAVLSAHLGELNILSPLQAIVAVCELGIILLLTPWITAWAWRRFKNGEWMTGALLASAWVGLIAPLFLAYQADRDISRFSAHGMLVFTVFLMIMVIESAGNSLKLIQKAGALVLAIMVFGGMVYTGVLLTATTTPILGVRMTSQDAQVLRDTWDKLAPDAQVFDTLPWRASMLTGLPTRAGLSGIDRLPAWEAVKKDPSIAQLTANGYRYVYLDEIWWNGLRPQTQAELSQECVVVVSEYNKTSNGLLRRLLDIKNCQP